MVHESRGPRRARRLHDGKRPPMTGERVAHGVRPACEFLPPESVHLVEMHLAKTCIHEVVQQIVLYDAAKEYPTIGRTCIVRPASSACAS